LPQLARRSAPTSPIVSRRRPSPRAALPRYELTGPEHAPLIVALGGISAHAHVAATPVDPTPGWWNDVVGDGRAIDTRRYRVLGVDFIDGGRAANGQPAAIVTTRDQADAVTRVLDAIGVARVHAFVGASYGGMVALAFAERHPERVERVVAISAPHAPHPMSTALRALQRNIVKLGLESGRVRESLALARGLAMTTYRSAREFRDRFDLPPVAQTAADATFAVEAYLAHHGDRFAATWSAERFLALSLSGDLHRVDPSNIRTPTVIVAAEGDSIVPVEQLETLAASLAGPTRLVHLPSTRGHDAFLTEPEVLGSILEVAIATTIVS
jgi:homoserine O-acetyltransferase